MTTILGENINVVRPEKIYVPVIEKGIVKPKYNRRSRRIREHTGKVVAFTIMLANQVIVASETAKTHLDIINQFCLDIDNVIKTGWLLHNGNYLWR